MFTSQIEKQQEGICPLFVEASGCHGKHGWTKFGQLIEWRAPFHLTRHQHSQRHHPSDWCIYSHYRLPKLYGTKSPSNIPNQFISDSVCNKCIRNRPNIPGFRTVSKFNVENSVRLFLDFVVQWTLYCVVCQYVLHNNRSSTRYNA